MGQLKTWRSQVAKGIAAAIILIIIASVNLIVFVAVKQAVRKAMG